ncbi:hypothetical protein KNN17_02145 [Arthrobacter bambusae]|nr:hypothetical protein [Arthrobacter bambusae]
MVSWSGMLPPEYATNWGSTATKNTIDFGLLAPTMKPTRISRHKDRDGGAPAAVGRPPR